MNRLTKKNNGTGSWTQFGDKYLPAHNIKHKQCVNKLGQLEDIEEELEIGLSTLFKVYNKLNNQKSIYIKLCSEIKEQHLYGCYFVIDFNEMAFRELDYDSECFYFKHYGKTWALDKEEFYKNIK